MYNFCQILQPLDPEISIYLRGFANSNETGKLKLDPGVRECQPRGV